MRTPLHYTVFKNKARKQNQGKEIVLFLPLSFSASFFVCVCEWRAGVPVGWQYYQLERFLAGLQEVARTVDVSVSGVRGAC